MNDATEPLKIIIGAAATTAAQRKIYFLIFNGVNAYRKTKKRKTKKQKSNANTAKCRTKRFRDEVIKERGGAKGGFWERKSLSALCLDFDFVHIVNLYTVFCFFLGGEEFLYCCNSFQWAALIKASENLTFSTRRLCNTRNTSSNSSTQ